MAESTSNEEMNSNRNSKRFSKSPLVASINSNYLDDSFKKDLGDAYKNNLVFKHSSNAELLTQPFPCAVLPNFIDDEHFLERLKDELLDQIFHEKSNDLYKFHQTDDLKKISKCYAKAIKKLFYGDVLNWLRDVTGIPLTDKVDLSCSRYEYTDTLLCHDDELSSRRIAFILYLVPPWKEEDGGLLDLFNTDENGLPSTIEKSLVPKWNNFAFFEVSPISFHQVSEILTDEKTRLSVNGWFHSPPIPRPTPYIEPARQPRKYEHIDEDVFYEWINPIYLDIGVQSQIQEKFENDSEIELQEFLKEEKYLEVAQALKSDPGIWEKRLPPNKRRYSICQSDKLPSILKDLLTMLKSEAMFLTLSNLTGLSLHELAPNSSDSDEEMTASCSKDKNEESNSDSDGKGSKKVKRRKVDESEENVSAGSAKNPRCFSEVRKWSHGDYTLLHDTDRSNDEYALDAMLYFNCAGLKEECGGYTSYIAKGEDEELLTVNPVENALVLVYRDKETLRFVKHINHQVTGMQGDHEFQDISVVYYE